VSGGCRMLFGKERRAGSVMKQNPILALWAE
jgi:hypothetical protein